MSAEICFDAYLSSVVKAYQKWEKQYTLTDVTGRTLQEKIVATRDVADEEPSFDYFDFGLMVQTVSDDKEKGEGKKEEEEGEREKKEKEKEKIERLPVLEGICKYAVDHVLLVGRPGSGKSTALARLLLQEAESASPFRMRSAADSQAKIPVLVELRYLPSEANELTVCDRIRAFMLKHDPALQLDVTAVENLLRQGRLLLLVDGVNELPSERARHQVNVFRQDYQKTCSMIFTTRELSAGGDLGIAKRLEMQPLTEPQMQQFVTAYLPTQGEKLLRQLSGRLREFGQTPLLLWMLCSLFRQTEQIPPNLGMVFRAFTLGYGNQIKQDVSLYKDSRVWWGRLLQYLAFVMIVGESATEARVAISRREAERVLVEFLQEKVEHPDDCAIRWLEDLLNHHLLQVSNDQIEFRHQLIQEYYAAEWLLGLLPSLSDARLQHDYLNYLKWTEPLALMLELVESEEQAVRVVRLALEVDLRLGARLAGAVRYGFQERTVGLLIREIEDRKIPKLYAIKLLGETKSEFAIKPLEFLYTAFQISRVEVAKSLGNIGGNNSVKSLIYILKDPDCFVRVRTIDALERIGNENTIEPLIQALRDNQGIVVSRAVEALGNIGGDKAVEPLVQALEDESFSVRKNFKNIVQALAKIGTDKAIKCLITLFQYKDKDTSLKYFKSEDLGRFGRDNIVELLIKTLTNDKNVLVRERVIEALGKTGNYRAIEPLMQSLKSEEVALREVIVEALGDFHNNIVVETLLQILENDRNTSVRKKAAASLGKIGSDKAIMLLIQTLKDPHLDMRPIAAKALGEIGNVKAVEPLIQALENQSDSLRSSVLVSLGKIKSKKAVESLIQCLKDEKSDICCKAAKALGGIGDKKAVEPLIQVLEYSNCYAFRSIAAESLGKIGSDRAINALIKVLNNEIQTPEDEDSILCEKIVEALKKISYEKAIEFLMEQLNHRDHRGFMISVRVIDALGNLGSTRPITILAQTLKSTDEYGTHWVAVEAIRKIAENTTEDLTILAQQLPELNSLISREFDQEIFSFISIITAIQSRCKYYNYDIAQMTLPPEDKANPTTGNTFIFREKVAQVIAGDLIDLSGNNKQNR